MIDFIKPVNLNGAELREELRQAKIDISDNPLAISVTGNILSLDIKDKDKDVAERVVAIHNGTVTPPVPSIEQKLAFVGLTLDELKAALQS